MTTGENDIKTEAEYEAALRRIEARMDAAPGSPQVILSPSLCSPRAVR